MLTENRKRQRSGGDEESGHLVPQAKRPSRGHPLSPEPGRDAWDSESSNSESSNSSSSISSPEHAAGSRCVAGPCSPLSSSDSSEPSGPPTLVSYLQINRILKHAHFQSLQCRGHLRDTWRPDVSQRTESPEASRSTTCWFTSLGSSHPSPVTVISHSSTYLWMETSSWSGIWRDAHHSNKSKW